MARSAIVALVAVLVAGAVTAVVAGRGAQAGAVPPVPVAGAGSGAVTLSADAADHPAATGVRAQLQHYFDAINARDYAAWRVAVTPDRAAVLPEPVWTAAYRSTRDGTIRVDRIDDAPGPALLVRVRFVSTQDLADAPPQLKVPRICWRSTLPMLGVPPRIGTAGDGTTLSTAC